MVLIFPLSNTRDQANTGGESDQVTSSVANDYVRRMLTFKHSFAMLRYVDTVTLKRAYIIVCADRRRTVWCLDEPVPVSQRPQCVVHLMDPRRTIGSRPSVHPGAKVRASWRTDTIEWPFISVIADWMNYSRVKEKWSLPVERSKKVRPRALRLPILCLLGWLNADESQDALSSQGKTKNGDETMYDFTNFWFTSTHFNIRWIRLKSTLY